MIDQRQYASSVGLLDHHGRLFCIHRHRLFAEYRLAMFQGCESDLHVSSGRGDNTDEIHVAMSDEFQPVVTDSFYCKLLSNSSGAFFVPARNRHNLRAHAIAKAWDLGSAGKPGPYNPDSNQ